MPVSMSSSETSAMRSSPRVMPAAVRITPTSSHIASCRRWRSGSTRPGAQVSGWVARAISAVSTSSSTSRSPMSRTSRPITSPAMPP